MLSAVAIAATKEGSRSPLLPASALIWLSSVQLRLPGLQGRAEPGLVGRELGLPALDVWLHAPAGAAEDAAAPLLEVLGLVPVQPQRWRWPGQRLRRPRPGSCSTMVLPPSCSRLRAAGGSSMPRAARCAGHMEAMCAAMNAAHQYRVGGTGERRDDSFRRRSAQQRLERDWCWTPTPVEVTAIVHAIWPETAGRPVQLPGFAHGQTRRRYPVSSKAQHAKHSARSRCGSSPMRSRIWASMT